jgi:hypothetical protein
MSSSELPPCLIERINRLAPYQREQLCREVAELRNTFGEAVALQGEAESLPVNELANRWGSVSRALRGALTRVNSVLPLPAEFEELLAEGPSWAAAWGLTATARTPPPEEQACLHEAIERHRARRRAACELLEHVEAALAPLHGPPDGTDADDYMPASDCLADIVPHSFKRLRKVLAENSTIRHWSPNSRRLMVHVGDWRRYVRGRKRQDDALMERAEGVAAEVRRVRQCHAGGDRATF